MPLLRFLTCDGRLLWSGRSVKSNGLVDGSILDARFGTDAKPAAAQSVRLDRRKRNILYWAAIHHHRRVWWPKIAACHAEMAARLLEMRRTNTCNNNPGDGLVQIFLPAFNDGRSAQLWVDLNSTTDQIHKFVLERKPNLEYYLVRNGRPLDDSGTLSAQNVVAGCDVEVRLRGRGGSGRGRGQSRGGRRGSRSQSRGRGRGGGRGGGVGGSTADEGPETAGQAEQQEVAAAPAPAPATPAVPMMTNLKSNEVPLVDKLTPPPPPGTAPAATPAARYQAPDFEVMLVRAVKDDREVGKFRMQALCEALSMGPLGLRTFDQLKARYQEEVDAGRKPGQLLLDTTIDYLKLYSRNLGDPTKNKSGYRHLQRFLLTSKEENESQFDYLMKLVSCPTAEKTQLGINPTDNCYFDRTTDGTPNPSCSRTSSCSKTRSTRFKAW